MVLSTDKITDIFYYIDEFCQEFDRSIEKHSLGNKPKRKPKMSKSEVITIMIMFHLQGLSLRETLLCILCTAPFEQYLS